MKISKKWLILFASGIFLLSLGLYFKADLRILAAGLNTLRLGQQTSKQLAEDSQAGVMEINFSSLIKNWPRLENGFDQLVTNYPKSIFFKKWLKPSSFTQIKSGFVAADAFVKTLNQKQTWLVMFQNSNELRASGGFMGSYGLLTLDRGQISEFVIEDVYDADGQWQGLVEAPAGAEEYLSSGKGLRLPDANWAADFPSAAKQVKFFIESVKKIPIDGVIAINEQVFAELLQITGPIKLKDYQLTLTADNIDDLLQDRPQEFFPGSRQKVNLLDQTKTQLALTIKKLPAEQQKQLFQLLKKQFQQKNILIFSSNLTLEEKLVSLGLAGQLDNQDPTASLLYLLESNVGINKVNQWVERMVTLNFQEEEVILTLDFTNQANQTQEKNGSLYVNYQRLIIPQAWSVKTITVDDQTVTWDQTEITTTNKTTFQQIGWLVVVKPKSQTQTQIVLSYNGPKPPAVKLIKQPGLKETNYLVFGSKTNASFKLTQDYSLELD